LVDLLYLGNMDLYLRKSDDGQPGPEIYRVILKEDGDEVEIGSISVQHSAGAEYYWKWAIDTMIPMRTHQTRGREPTACGSSKRRGPGSPTTMPT
jgi:hypothetical protein